MAKKYKRYNFKTDKRVGLYDYRGWPTGHKNNPNLQHYGGRNFDVSVESLRRKLDKFYPHYTWKIKRVKTNKQLRNDPEYKNMIFN